MYFIDIILMVKSHGYFASDEIPYSLVPQDTLCSGSSAVEHFLSNRLFLFRHGAGQRYFDL
jgi:hypothetical protein